LHPECFATVGAYTNACVVNVIPSVAYYGVFAAMPKLNVGVAFAAKVT